MASGDTLAIFTPHDNEPPSAAYATLDTRNGHLVLDFDQSTDEEAVFSCVLPRNYGGGGITVYLHLSATGITTGNHIMETQFERVGDGSQDVDSDGFATAVAGAATAVAGTDGHVDIVAIAHTDGAQIDSIAVGEKFRLKVRRDANNASDTAAADMELHAVELKET